MRKLAEAIGRERILVMHGEADKMMAMVHNEVLVRGLNAGVDEVGGKVENRIFVGVGHVVPLERRDDFRNLVLALVERTEGMR